MLKLRFLFNNENLAAMILGNWQYDPDSTELFKYFRISANAVYPFRNKGRVCFLRFAPVSEKSPDQVSGELDFLKYLKQSGYNVPAVIESKKGNYLEIVRTPWGEYVAEAFEGVPGRQLEGMPQDNELIYGYGSSLGKLHKLSSQFCPKLYKRWNWSDALDWMRDVLSGLPAEESALKEVRIIKDYLSRLPADDKNYGLIHYDFETDNVFYEREKSEFHAIDFDDAMYHWYAMDVEQALESASEDLDPTAAGDMRNCFIEGYRSQFALEDDMLALLPVFRRFANIYGYTRIVRSVQEQWKNEPEWLTNLRIHLEMLRKTRAADFGKAIEV